MSTHPQANRPALRFSAVINCYNYQDYVCEAVQSALDQTLPPLEVVVINDGSTDESAARLHARFGGAATVRIIEHENRGQLAAFIAGVNAARGDIVCFLDADDLWEPDYLAALSAAYAGAQAPDLVLSNLRRFGRKDGIWRKRRHDRDLGLGILASWRLQHFEVTPSSAISMRRPLALAALDLPESYLEPFNIWADDCMLHGALIHGGRCLVLAQPHVRYRMHQSNHSSTRFSPITLARHVNAVTAAIQHQATRAGLTRQHLHFANLEFRTKQSPTLAELRLYLWMQLSADQPLSRRLRCCGSIFKHYLRSIY